MVRYQQKDHDRWFVAEARGQMAWEQQALFGEVLEAELAMVSGLFCSVIPEISPTPLSE